MSRRMSCSMTVEAVRARTKTVTRRRVNSWTTLKSGDRLTLIEKGMGLPKGAKQVVLAEVEIIDVRIEPLGMVRTERGATAAEGLPDMSPLDFMIFWAKGHGYTNALQHGLIQSIPCRRIEWRYLDGDPR